MKKFSKKMTALAVAAAMAAAVALSACSGSTEPSEPAEPAEPAAPVALSIEGADPTSILAVPAHAKLGFTAESVTDVATCGTCHSYASLVEKGEGKLMDPDSGTIANPHFNHQYLSCTDCHAVSTQSVMYCDSCHEFVAPQGWAYPTMDAAELGYVFDVSGLNLPPYAEAGRDTTKLPAEALDGVAQLQANPELMNGVMASFMASALGPEAFAAMMAAQAAGEAPAL